MSNSRAARRQMQQNGRRRVMADVVPNPAKHDFFPEDFRPRYNGYKCIECGQAYLAIDLAAGVTPMFMTCFRTEDCGGQAVSMGYPQGTPPPDLPLLVEWIAPTQDLIEEKSIKHPGLLQHFNRGGLMRRAAPDAPDWVKALM